MLRLKFNYQNTQEEEEELGITQFLLLLLVTKTVTWRYLWNQEWSRKKSTQKAKQKNLTKFTKNIKHINNKKIRIFGDILDFFAIVFGFLCDFLDFSNALSNHCTVVWVTRPERPKGVKDVVKQIDFFFTFSRLNLKPKFYNFTMETQCNGSKFHNKNLNV